MVSQPCAFRIPAGVPPSSNRNNPNPDQRTGESPRISQGLASEPPDQRSEPERLPWLQAMNGLVWERLARIPRRRGGLPYGWGPHAVRAAYVRCFGRPPHWDRRRYVYSQRELLAVADLLEAEAAAWGAGR